MVEINNQRKAFLDMLAWSEGTDNGRRNQKSWLWRHCRRRAIYWLLRSPSQTCHAKPKTQINRRRTLPAFPVGGMPTASSLAWRLLSESQDAVALQQIKERGALPMIDRGDIRQAIDRCSNIWASLPGAGYGQFEHKADSLIAKFKAHGRNGQRDWRMSRVTAIILLWLSASSSACHGLLIITVITPLPTKPSATKMPENWNANAAITDMQMRQRDVAALDAKYTKELADAKAEKWCSAWWCCRWSSSVAHRKAVCQSVREATTPPAWIMQPPPDWQTPLNGLFHPQREADHYAKTTGRNPEVY